MPRPFLPAVAGQSLANLRPALYKRGMNGDPNKWFGQSLDTLTYNRNQRVWSILVTIFGDLARTPGDRISGAVLSRLTEPMGIKPEAMRVALHRLRGDGWLTSERVGRASHYSLTASGLEQSDAASPRIYGSDPAPSEQWHVVVAEPARGTARSGADKSWRARGYIIAAPGCYLGQGPAPADLENHLVLTGTLSDIPLWLRATMAPEETAQAYRDLETALDGFFDIMQGAPTPSPLQAAILRVVIVHNWRRALLAHPPLPAAFFPSDWRGFTCRDKVMAALDMLPQPNLQSLEDTAAAA